MALFFDNQTESFGQRTTKVKQLADRISQDVLTGIYKEEDALPSVNGLSEKYKVSRDTAFKAYIDLKERGIINSTPGKGYYVATKQKNILLLLDEYSPFKDMLYNSLIKSLPAHYKVDLWFHRYNEYLFNSTLRNSLGRYNKYIVMNFDNEQFSPLLYGIDSDKLLLLDFGKFDKQEYSFICQDFDDAFYQTLAQLSNRISRYRKFILLFAKGIKHPHSACNSFRKYCTERRIPHEVREEVDPIEVRLGEAYIAIRQEDVVEVIKKCNQEGWVCGVDVGLIAYNETPAYEVIDKGITSLSINWEKMGTLAAEFIRTSHPVHAYLPTEIKLRGSL